MKPEEKYYANVIIPAREKIDEDFKNLLDGGQLKYRIDCSHFPPIPDNCDDESNISTPVGDGHLIMKVVDDSARRLGWE